MLSAPHVCVFDLPRSAKKLPSCSSFYSVMSTEHRTLDAVVPSAANDDLKEPPVSAVEEYYRNSRSSSERLELEWNDIEFSVHVKDGKSSTIGNTVYQERKILNKCSGKTESGRMLAIMGPTGCGKTSLMNVLAARVAGKGSETQSLTGSITVNGTQRTIINSAN